MKHATVLLSIATLLRRQVMLRAKQHLQRAVVVPKRCPLRISFQLVLVYFRLARVDAAANLGAV